MLCCARWLGGNWEKASALLGRTLLGPCSLSLGRAMLGPWSLGRRLRWRCQVLEGRSSSSRLQWREQECETEERRVSRHLDLGLRLGVWTGEGG
ncbi:hypothetical protein AAHE18_05G089500 [Arachis hypogaea]